MSKREDNAYILGTDNEELYRLGLQHQVWATDAQQAWKAAAFNRGQTILDLGCGPGFCTKELAFIAGATGKVIAVDKSVHYIQYLKEVAALHRLNIETLAMDFDEMELEDNSLDGMYCRWALAWLSNPKAILKKVFQALKPGGKMVIQEYYDWSTHQTEPMRPMLAKAIAGALRSFKESDGEIDIGRELPTMLEDLGMKITKIRPMAKLVRPQDFEWSWPKSFYEVYFPKLVELNYLTEVELAGALKDINDLEKLPNTTLCCPLMIEVIAEKV